MKQFEDVSAKHGAPMGRPNVVQAGDIVHVFEVEMVDGDYDDGGAYWGGPPSDPLFCARGSETQVFTRANTLKDAVRIFEQEYPELIVVTERFDLRQMTKHYLIAAAWAESGDSESMLGETPPPWSKEAKRQALRDCEEFVTACRQEGITYEELDSWDAEQVGHDFWLSRQGHGVGFRDRGRGALGDRLHKVAKSLGDKTLWVENGEAHYE